MANRWWAAVLGGFMCGSLAGCGDEPAPTIATCAEENQVRGVCAGLATGDVCDGERCTEGVACASVVDVGSDAELTSAATTAASGTCLALRPGRYGAVDLPGGVSLLGRSAGAATVAGVTLAAGAGAVLRGLTVGRDGVRVAEGATGVRIEAVRVVGERAHAHDSVAVEPGASVTIVGSELVDAGRAGIYAANADVTVERTIVSGAQRGGIRFEGDGCDARCVCATRPALDVKRSVIRRNHIAGIAMVGAEATLEGVDVLGTEPGDVIETGNGGGGVVVASCANLVGATQVRVLDSAQFGVLVDGATAALGAEGEEASIEISRNKRGLWIQNVCPTGGAGCVSLHNGKLQGNLGVGVGVTGQSRGIILCRSAVTGTLLDPLPVFGARDEVTVDQVGDGVDWLEGSVVTLEELTFRGNARQSLLLDGPVSGHIGAIDVAGDADKPPVQQNFTMGERPTGTMLPTRAERALAIPLPL